MKEERPYADPYIAGAMLGLVLLAAFVLAGRGLGASGAFAQLAAPFWSGPLHDRYLGRDSWLLFEIFGVFIGGFLSALLAGRVRARIERGPCLPRRARIALAFGGGALMGFGAILARGCTSGLALTGGALLGVGSWLFMIAAFAAAYLVAPLVRRAWQ